MLESSHPRESQPRESQRRRAARRRSSTPPSPPQPQSRGRSDVASDRLRSQPLNPQHGSTQRPLSNHLDSRNSVFRDKELRRESTRSWGESRPGSQPRSARRVLPGSAADRRSVPGSESGTARANLSGATALRPKATARQGRADRDANLQRPAREKRDRRPTSPFLHLVRLLILGVGVGAIAGTILSIWNPAIHPSALATQQINSSALGGGGSGGGGTGGRSTVATLLAKGQELTGLTPKILPMTQVTKELIPGAFLVDLDTGDYFSLNGSSSFASASMIKVPILIALLQDVDAGRVRLNEKLVLQQVDVAEGSGDMQYSPVGSDYTVLQTITNMITISDNTATNMVIRRLGGIEVVNQRFRQWGLQQTVIRHLLPDLEGTNTTSPKELSMLMAMLSQGELLSMKSRDRALDIMQHTVTDTLLPTSLGEGSTISHKTGDIGSLVGDTGIIDMPNGKRYAITLMVKRPHNDDRAQELIRQMAGTVYDYLNQSVGGRSSAAPEASNPAEAVPSGSAEGSEPAAPADRATPGSDTPGSDTPSSNPPGAAVTQPTPASP